MPVHDFDICLIFLSLNKSDCCHVVLEALETRVNMGIIRAVGFNLEIYFKMYYYTL